ncbi:MAG: hypothetical protein R3320_13855 [Nitriliruptorales bacterium]|nr:hypothetical protein [Nitriliruptorales bacterium]
MSSGTSLNVTPAGNNLFQVEIEQTTGEETREAVVEVAVPDGFLDDLALEGDAGPQDVVLEAVRFVLDRTDHPDELEPRMSLDDVADQYPGFTESLGRRFNGAADKGSGTVHEQHIEDRTSQDSDDRLVEQVREEQAEGQASAGQERI